MTAIKHVLLGLFLYVIVAHVTECADENTTEAPPGLIEKILKLPINHAQNIIKLPLTIVQKLVDIITSILEQVGDVGSALISALVSLIKELVGQIAEVLVNVGVFQGKTVEDIINGVMGIIEKVVAFVITLETHISSTIVDTSSNITNVLNIKELRDQILNLPIVKDIAKLVEKLRQFIIQNFQDQINDIQFFFKQKFVEHQDFFQPIYDGISGRILIITNALHALVDGKLDECPGVIPGVDTPTHGLQWQLNVWIDRLKVILLRILGFADWADQIQTDINNLTTTTVASAETMSPGIFEVTTFPSFETTTPTLGPESTPVTTTDAGNTTASPTTIAA